MVRGTGGEFEWGFGWISVTHGGKRVAASTPWRGGRHQSHLPFLPGLLLLEGRPSLDEWSRGCVVPVLADEEDIAPSKGHSHFQPHKRDQLGIGPLPLCSQENCHALLYHRCFPAVHVVNRVHKGVKSLRNSLHHLRYLPFFFFSWSTSTFVGGL